MRDCDQVRRLGPSHREQALRLLARDPLGNLILTDLIAGLGQSGPGSEPAPQALGIWRRSELAGLAALRPALAIDSGADDEMVKAFAPYLGSVGPGLLKCDAALVDRLWKALRGRGRYALVDRMETAYWTRPEWCKGRDVPPGARTRPAEPRDLENLVFAARASLREEARPDPFHGDPQGFRRWVAGRADRALLVDTGEQVGFVGYADVRRTEGWLIQGVYTWPARRRHGLAAAGVSALCRMAFESGADHVQLAVVEGNRPAERLYGELGFRPFGRLRTILFA